MHKSCNRCGHDMSLFLRNVVFRKRVKIRNVPVYVCSSDDCSYSQIADIIKDDLKQLMNDLGQNPDRQDIAFETISEFANLLVMVADEEHADVPAEQLIEQRINDLLDLFLLARSLGDDKWKGEIRKRLNEILRSHV